jgi:hypothetical protein
MDVLQSDRHYPCWRSSKILVFSTRREYSELSKDIRRFTILSLSGRHNADSDVSSAEYGYDTARLFINLSCHQPASTYMDDGPRQTQID